MLLLNFCIFFLVDNVRKNRRRRNNRNSIIRRPLRSRSVSFSEPLVTQPRSNQKITSFQSSPRSLQDIEMVDLSSIPSPPIQDPPPPPKPLTSTLTKQRQPCRPAPPAPTQLSRHINFPNFPPPPPTPRLHLIEIDHLAWDHWQQSQRKMCLPSKALLCLEKFSQLESLAGKRHQHLVLFCQSRFSMQSQPRHWWLIQDGNR